MNINVKRQELKYLVTDGALAIIRQRIKNLMSLDENADTPTYTISTLYFDTLFDDDLHEKLSGILTRKKHRIRIYDNSDSVIKFETKHKNGDLVYKESTNISTDMTKKLIEADYSEMLYSGSDHLRRCYSQFLINGYRPVTIVEYDREAYTLPYGNIRITFDKNLRTYNSETNLLSPLTAKIPTLDQGYQIIEIKFNIPLPSYIIDIMKYSLAIRQSISKYSICRKHLNKYSWQDEQ